MAKFKPKFKDKTICVSRNRHLNLFSILAVLMMGGILLALTASAAEDWPFDAGEGDLSTPDGSIMADVLTGTANQPPAITELESDKSSPQVAGSTIKWTAKAKDPEGERLSYLFQVKGPHTGGSWRTMVDWSYDSRFIWDTRSYSAGDYQIKVQVADPTMGEAEKIAYFQLTEPQPSPQEIKEEVRAAPVEEQAFVPTPVVSPYQEQTVIPDQGFYPDQRSYQEQEVEAQRQAPPNKAPVMTGLTSSPASPQEAGSMVSWTAEAVDDEGDGLQYIFWLDGIPQTDWQDLPQWIWYTSASQAGTHNIEALVRDNNHNSEGDSSKSSSFTLNRPNERPEIINFASDKSSPQEAGSTVVWAVEARDGDGDAIQYQFSLDGYIVQDWSDSPTWSWSPDQIGMHTVEARIRDGNHDINGDDARSGRFEIARPPNQAPALSQLSPDRQSPQMTGTVVTWSASASDAEGDPVQFQFSIDGNAVQDWSDSPTWSWTPDQAGVYTIAVSARDAEHPQGTEPLSASFEIVLPPNQPPALTGLVADKESPQVTGTAVTWTGTASDAEGDLISYRFQLNGTPVSDWQPEGLWVWTASEPGTSTITVQARDSQHEAAQGEAGNLSSDFTIIPAAPVTEEEAPLTAEDETQNETEMEQPFNESELVPTLPSALAENLTASQRENETENETEMEQPFNESELIPTLPEVLAENLTASQRENETASDQLINVTNETELLTPSPDTVIPEEENLTTPVTAENVTTVEPANETEAAKVEPVAVNQTPVLNSLTPDLSSPQVPGSSITWTADASDAENDSLSYRFYMSGPATGKEWKMVADWSASYSWTQETTTADVGENRVKVQIRDGNHAAEDGYDSEAEALFTISELLMNISGMAYQDKNGNNIRDDGEGLTGWTVRLNRSDGSELSTLTASDGAYRFEQLKAGSYKIVLDTPPGWSVEPASGSYDVDLQGADATDRNFVNKLSAFSISGKKYNDLDGNGVNDGEPGLEGWAVKLSGMTLEDQAVEKDTSTAADGSYKFESLSPGTYTVSEVEQSGWKRTAPAEGSYTVSLSDADVSGKDFGNHGSWAISGSVFLDSNGNGARDEDEAGQAGWSINLEHPAGTVINATTTAQDGSYAFKNLSPGQYTISQPAQEGWKISLPAEGSYSVDLANADVAGRDFGIMGDLSISGQKYYDINGNGAQDADEPGIPGGDVSLLLDGKVVANTTTDDNGIYTFKNILPATYTISDPVPSGLVLTTPSTVIVTVTGSTVVKANFGLVGMNAISGMKYNDKNGNGAKDAGEGEGGWDIVLTGNTWFGKPLQPRTTTTAPDGSYKFDRLIPGKYKVSETSRTGWTQIYPAGGSHAVDFSFHSPPFESKNNDFGNKLIAQSISGIKYNDLNGNSMRDPGEPGLPGWTINLEQPAGTVIKTAVTAADGSYSFTDLAAGTYVITEVLQPGWTQKAPSGGLHTVTLTASTSSASGKDFGNSINNLPPKDPTLISNKPSPQMAGTLVRWTAGAADPEGDSLLYRFYVMGPTTGGMMQPQTGWTGYKVWNWGTGAFAPGKYQLEVRIRDGKHAGPDGFDIKQTASFTLASPNRPPRVDVLFSDRPAPQYTGSWVRWTAVARDPEGDPLQYKFYLRGPSTRGFWIDQTGWGRNNRWTWRTDPWDVGFSEVLVAVRDGNHAGPGGSDDHATASYSIIMLNQPPAITGLASNVMGPQPIGAAIRWQASAIDPEGNPVFFRYWLNGPATRGAWRMVRDWSTDPTWIWFTSPADAGVSHIQVQVMDGLHTSPMGWDDDAGALFTVLRPNQPPALISLKPNRSSPQSAGTPVSWTALASDPDREAVYYKFWLKGPATGNAWKVVQDWSIKNQWIWTSAGYDGGAYSVYVYARDGKHNPDTAYDSALGAAFSLSPNQPPKVTALTPDKKSPQSAGTALTWTAKATDANKDPILYRFWLKGPATGDAWKVVQDWSPSSQWTWTSSGYDGGDYAVYVYVRDGRHKPETSFDSAIGANYKLAPNAPPQLASLIPDRKSPQNAGGVIRWSASAIDADKDPLLYQFWLRGPATGNAWRVAQDWSARNQWTWTSAPVDGGMYRVYVFVSDGRHAPPNAYDSAMGQDYQLLNALPTNRMVVVGRR